MDELPTSFGKYFLTEKIATGGMAEIFLAKLIGPGGFEKPLVIKQIHPELSDARFVDMFVAEAKTLVSLGHGNIVPVYELGVIDDVYFLAMEYIDGPTLRELGRALAARDGSMAPPIAALIAAEILQGLDYAHRKGVIHRDLSPRNVMLSRDGEVKLVDFGIAVRDEDSQEADALVGSYPYMSPEQARGRELTGQSDVFSAGVLLWEMLTGCNLFARASAEDTLRAVVHADIEPPSAVQPGVPAALDRVCMRALCREPDQRYATAGEALAELHPYLYSLSEPVTAVTLSQLVARYCPPVVRGRGSEPARAGTDGGAQTRRVAPAPDSDATRPLPGRRAPTARTFATNSAFQEVLTRATRPADEPADDAADVSADMPDDPPARPGSRRMAWAMAALSLVVVAAAVAIGVGRLADAPGSAMPGALADAAALASRHDAAMAGSVAPQAADAAIAVIDAAAAKPRERAAPERPAREPAPAEPGMLKVGANPWAEVYVDGRHVGRAPDAWPVAPGEHTVDVVFPVPGHEQKRSFFVTVRPQQTTSLGVVDFSGDFSGGGSGAAPSP